MANTKRDDNRVPALLTVSNIDNETPVVLWGDPATHELLVQGSLSVTGSQGIALQQKVTTNDLIVTLDSESVAVTNADITTVAGAVSGGHMQVDVLSGGGAGEQYADNAAVNAAYKGNLVLGTDGSNYQVLSVDSSGNVQVDIVSSASIGVTNAGITTIAGAVTGTEMQVDVITLPAITGTVTANLSATDNAVLDAIAASVAGTLTVGSHAVTNAGTFAVQVDGNALTALQLIDDTIFTDDATFTPATSKVSMAGFEYDDTTPDSVNEGDAGAARMSANRNQYVTIRDAAGSERGLNIDASGQLAITVASIPSHAVTNAGTFITQENGAALTALQLIDNAISGAGFNITQLGGAAVPIGAGLESTAVRVTLPTDGTGVVKLGAGTAGIGKLTANSGVDIGDVDVTSEIPGVGATNLGKAEDAGHTTGDTGVFSLGVRNDTLADVTTATADYSQLSTDLKGRLMVGSAPRTLKVQQITTITSSTSETTVLTAVASTYLDVYGVIVVNSSATAANIAFKDDTAGTTRFNIYVPAGDTRGFMLPIDAAVNQGATNDNWTATSSASVASIIITMLAVKTV